MLYTEEWNGLSNKLAHANREKCEAQAQVSEFQSQIVTSQVSHDRSIETVSSTVTLETSNQGIKFTLYL